MICIWSSIVSDIAIFVVKRDVKLQLTNYGPADATATPSSLASLNGLTSFCCHLTWAGCPRKEAIKHVCLSICFSVSSYGSHTIYVSLPFWPVNHRWSICYCYLSYNGFSINFICIFYANPKLLVFRCRLEFGLKPVVGTRQPQTME